VWLYRRPTDMRKSYNGLSALAKHVLNEDPLSGALFVFINRRRTQLKCLYFDCDGYCIWAKRLERGLFQGSWSDDVKCSLDAKTLQYLIDGIDLKRVRQLTRFGRGTGTSSPHESGYITLERQSALRVFLSDPDVAVDTSHLEHALRPIPMGCKSWLFCTSEVGAKHVGYIQSLLTTCRLHDVDPYVYLTDVLQRVAIHPDSAVKELTPRRWKTCFADNPLLSELQLLTQSQA
jgi:hypothetical protein